MPAWDKGLVELVRERIENGIKEGQPDPFSFPFHGEPEGERQQAVAHDMSALLDERIPETKFG